MLAGYLPFDDDPANPEGDNINLLYKYITSTPLTFPEYVTPHARDLLRRILVPDPRKRADLFEVARHSWLSEYHHVVSHITSSTTNIADIQNSTITHGKLQSETGRPATKFRSDDQLEAPILNRSASVREPSKTPSATSPIGALTHHQANLTQADDVESSRSQRDRNARHTLQPEYVAPQSHTARGEGSAAAVSEAPRAPTSGGRGQIAVAAQSTSRSKPLPQEPAPDSTKVADYPGTSITQQKMPPPTRPARDVPRSVSDSTGAFGMPPAAPSTSNQQVTRPSTGGSMTSISGPSGTRSDIRLPSRGSYGQPVAPTVAVTNVQGRVTQPTNGRGYSISGPIPQQVPQSIGQPMTQPLPAKYNETPAAPPAQPAKNHHRRSSTLSGLGERLFGRSGSVMKKQDRDSPRHNNGRKYPPTSMKEPYAVENPGRPSMDSKRSFSFGLGKKKSIDLESQQEEKSGRRFSLIPPSMSFKGMMGGAKDQGDPESPVPQPGDFPQPPNSRGQSRPPTSQHPPMNSYDLQQGVYPGNDGQFDQQRPVKVNNFSRPPQQYQQNQKTSSQAQNDVYGGTGVYAPTSQYIQHQERSYLSGPTPPVESEARRPNQGQAQYPEGFNEYDRPRPSMQQGRQGKGPAVLQKPNRKFVDVYTNEQGPTHHEGSSGPAKKVMDFFRRRGRARVDDYR
jgi:protein-serine/threonine kinase